MKHKSISREAVCGKLFGFFIVFGLAICTILILLRNQQLALQKNILSGTQKMLFRRMKSSVFLSINYDECARARCAQYTHNNILNDCLKTFFRWTGPRPELWANHFNLKHYFDLQMNRPMSLFSHWTLREAVVCHGLIWIRKILFRMTGQFTSRIR